ncbi:MAG: hypothetical protein P8X79_07970 [Reinekea sp.]
MESRIQVNVKARKEILRKLRTIRSTVHVLHNDKEGNKPPLTDCSTGEVHENKNNKIRTDNDGVGVTITDVIRYRGYHGS